jgi:HEAT repeat protein
VRHTAAWALGTIGDARAIDPLTTILKDESSDLRAVAA